MANTFTVAFILHKYLEARAMAESVAYELSSEFFRDQIKKGVRTFFGVTPDWSSSLPEIFLHDTHNPEFLKEWYARWAKDAPTAGSESKAVH